VIPYPVTFFGGQVAAGPAFRQAQFSSSIIVTDELPVDDTVPLIGEGTEILSIGVTPQSAASRFLVEAVVFASTKFFADDASAMNRSQSLAWGAALFRDATCIDAHGADAAANDPDCNAMRLTVLDQPATASPLTWSVRVGPSRLSESGSPSQPGLGLRLNGTHRVISSVITTNHRLFGGVAKCTLTVQELP
jgi:hypothetical protein